MTIAHPAHEPTTREERALELYRTRRTEIWSVGEDLYRVPSCTGETVYIVDYARETCSCPDAEFHPDLNCKHLLAVGIHHAKRRGRGCSACYRGVVYLTCEEDGHEWTEPVPCRRCNPR